MRLVQLPASSGAPIDAPRKPARSVESSRRSQSPPSHKANDLWHRIQYLGALPNAAHFVPLLAEQRNERKHRVGIIVSHQNAQLPHEEPPVGGSREPG